MSRIIDSLCCTSGCLTHSYIGHGGAPDFGTGTVSLLPPVTDTSGRPVRIATQVELSVVSSDARGSRYRQRAACSAVLCIDPAFPGQNRNAGWQGRIILQCGMEKRRVIGIQRHPNARIHKLAQGMALIIGVNRQGNIGCRADFQRNVFLHQSLVRAGFSIDRTP